MAFRSRSLQQPTSAAPETTGPSPPAALDSGFEWPSTALQVSDEALPGTPASVADARLRSARWVHSLRSLAPSLRRAWTEDLNPEQQAAAFQQQIQSAQDLAQAWADKLAVEGPEHAWFVQGVQAALLEADADLQLWQTHGLAWSRLIDQATASLAPVFRPSLTLSESLAVHMALLRGLAPVVAAQQRYDFARGPSRDADMMMAAEWLVSQSALHLERWADASLGAEERRTILGTLVEEGGRLLAHAWEHAAIRAQVVLRSKSAREIEVWRRAHPEGFPLDPVFQSAQEAFDRLVRLVQAIQPKGRTRRA
jgi:hypothetical protein